MEPSITGGLSQDVDLTRYQYADIGWFTGPVAVDHSGPTPVDSRLLGNIPNPFGRATAIRYALAKEADVEIGVYDLAGRLVRRIAQGRMSVGTHSVAWDGTDRTGARVSPGVYLCRLRGVADETRSMVLVK
jgi:hypothetical protein